MNPQDYLRGCQASDIELVCLVTGISMTAAAALLDRAPLHRLASMTPQGIACMPVPGLGPARAARLHAALTLGVRSAEAPTLPDSIRTPEDAYSVFKPRIAHLPHEELHAAYLDRRYRPLAVRCLTRGSDGLTVVDPRQVFRPAIEMGACAVVLAHNHPSGDASPSAMDREVTRRVSRAGDVLGVKLLDHVVVTRSDFSSLAEEGCCP